MNSLTISFSVKKNNQNEPSAERFIRFSGKIVLYLLNAVFKWLEDVSCSSHCVQVVYSVLRCHYSAYPRLTIFYSPTESCLLHLHVVQKGRILYVFFITWCCCGPISGLTRSWKGHGISGISGKVVEFSLKLTKVMEKSWGFEIRTGILEMSWKLANRSNIL